MRTLTHIYSENHVLIVYAKIVIRDRKYLFFDTIIVIGQKLTKEREGKNIFLQIHLDFRMYYLPPDSNNFILKRTNSISIFEVVRITSSSQKIYEVFGTGSELLDFKFAFEITEFEDLHIL